MPQRHDDDEQSVILDGVEEAMAPDTDAQSRPTAKRLGPWWAGVDGQQGDGTLETRLVLVVDPSQRS